MQYLQFPHLPLARLCSLSAMLLSSLTCAAQVVEDFPITPYRPSVSSPAELPVTGQLEMELGGLSTRDDKQRRHSLPYQLKLAFSPEWGVLMGGELMVLANDGAGMVDRGLGDTTLVLKRAFIVNDDRAFGLEFAVKTPTAAKALGSGRADYSINSIFSQDDDILHLDMNLNLARLGVFEEGSSRWQTGTSASLSAQLNERWDATAEWSGTRRSGTKAQGQALLAISYSPNKRLTMDVGVAKGLTTSSPGWSVFTGLVIPVAKLW